MLYRQKVKSHSPTQVKVPEKDAKGCWGYLPKSSFPFYTYCGSVGSSDETAHSTNGRGQQLCQTGSSSSSSSSKMLPWESQENCHFSSKFFLLFFLRPYPGIWICLMRVLCSRLFSFAIHGDRNRGMFRRMWFGIGTSFGVFIKIIFIMWLTKMHFPFSNSVFFVYLIF